MGVNPSIGNAATAAIRITVSREIVAIDCP